MIITKIEPQRKRSQRKSIFLDGEFAFGIHDEVLLKFGLRHGDSLTPERVAEITAYEEFRSAREKALRLLNRRPRTEKEIRTKLLAVDYGEETVQKVVEQLCDTGLLDDSLYAVMYARDIMARRPVGKPVLKQKLRLKGIPENTILAVIREVFPDDEQAFAFARALAAKRLERQEKIRSIGREADALKRRKQIADFLARRGFGWDTVRRVLDDILQKE
ncbi:MAG: hypothetical protein COS95_07895 [Ignavibacteriales bacterium CG07_land_8_20_14_0_80_59_12]|nr:MAG: hypothetical protein COS95_07895 [Ignavibacteriales bacterium CG07_land_8_20_14_0_80_59_12]